MFLKSKNEEQKVSKPGVLSNGKSNIVKKAAISVLLISSISFNMAFAKESESNTLKEIYHIYTDGQYVGTISDQTKIQSMLDKKVEKSSSQYKNMTLTAGSNLSVVSEQVFTPNTNDETTLQKLEGLIEVEAKAFALSVNDEMAVYVKDIDAYHEAIRKLKLHFVSQDELNILEARNNTSNSLPELKENETRIANLILKEKVSGVTVQTAPTKIVSPDDAVKLLLEGTLEKEVYAVAQGDVLGTIASKHNLTSDELIALNPGITDSSVLQIGQELNVTVLKPLINIEVQYEKKVKETIVHTKKVEETESMYKGDTKVKQEGSDGQKVATYLIRKENGVQVGQSVVEETIIVEPKDHIVLKGTKVIPSRGSGAFAWPAEGGYISSKMGYRWGRQHEGIDIARPSGFTIKAADNGIVVAAGWDGTYGQRVIIDHQNGYKTTYAHLSSISAKVGQVVPTGTKIGVMGSTGRSTGTHLHFEVEKNGVTINPLTVLNK
ncbi:Murein DD-endopeptidase MepM and murein hydrolase activator NlpD, contain LysM domain [Psychrobacillus sp. OK028]|uniref:peptidoglycan DD-metalloendopeptidase family protein n=1 Tax=Psychrobacillus sp. OK028 TaxID=1884359 RepID=UPI000888F87C|nr:peptidoglycan DD-metalloendopeptidase family protein [Psychrobacillus sp. OK028]SDN85732.1 Murein DD-endopeptidase MepM and murein hydrolase activator NlpD, contain LysM domain [Psychrobacillus sp. OK028]